MLPPSSRDVRRPRGELALLPVRASPSWGGGSTAAVLERCLVRWRGDEATSVDPHVSAHDDMLVDTPEGRVHYRAVGLSALRLVTEAMPLTGRTDPARILDLPCGGGRVTRHLVKFFPEAEIAVADLDARKAADVVAQVGVTAITSSKDFSAPLPGSYDLIFVGSLVTHFDAPLFARAVNVMIDALAPGGVLVLTSAGRNWAALSGAEDRVPGSCPGAGGGRPGRSSAARSFRTGCGRLRATTPGTASATPRCAAGHGSMARATAAATRRRPG